MRRREARDDGTEPQEGVGERILKMEGLTTVHAWARDTVKLEQLKTCPRSEGPKALLILTLV